MPPAPPICCSDGDGNITVDELKLVLKEESDEVVQRYIDEFDLNKDGVISYEVSSTSTRTGSSATR